jgi:hypothetical protein
MHRRQQVFAESNCLERDLLEEKDERNNTNEGNMINLMSAEQELVYSPYVAKFQQPMESE